MAGTSEGARKAWLKRARGSSRPSESDRLGTWTENGQWVPRDEASMKEWQSRGGVAPGDVPVPYPVWTPAEAAATAPGEQDWWHGKRPINTQQPHPKAVKKGLMRFPLKDLVATQHVVTEASVGRNVGRLRKGEERSPYGDPVVVLVEGVPYIWDGHHRLSAARIMGRADLLMEVWEVPSEKAA